MPTRKKRRKADDGMVGKTLEYLATQQDVYAERRNSGSVKIGTCLIKLGEAGTLDVSGYLMRAPFAVPFEIEAKSSKGELRKSQKKRMAMLDRLGVPYCTAKSLADVVQFLARLRGRYAAVST